MLRASSFALLVAGVSACATTRVVPRTSPDVETTSRDVPELPSRAVLVVGRETLHAVAPDIALERGVADAPPPGDDALVLPPLERALFEAGWDPVSQPTVARLVTGHRVAIALRDLLARGNATLLDAAAVVSPESTADSILVIRGWSLGWAAAPTAVVSDWAVCPLTADLVLSLHDRAARLLWQARVRVRTTDLSDTHVTAERERAWAVPPSSCIARGGCGACAGPVAPQDEAALAEHAVRVLLSRLPPR